jgi:hypothetical protein
MHTLNLFCIITLECKNEDDHELLYKEIQKRMKEDTKIEIHEVIV